MILPKKLDYKGAQTNKIEDPSKMFLKSRICSNILNLQ